MGLAVSTTPAALFTLISTVCFIMIAQGSDKRAGFRQRRGGVGSVVFTVAVLVLVGILMIYATRPTKVTFLDTGLKLHGMYGVQYSWEEIEQVKLLQELPTIRTRTNGSAVGSHLKGYFQTAEYGKVKLLVDRSKPPFIYLEVDNSIVIFNVGTAEETEALFQELSQRVEAERT